MHDVSPSQRLSMQRCAQIAIQGCCHGELDKIYETMQQLEESQGIKIDLLLCCGDFQVRRPVHPSRR